MSIFAKVLKTLAMILLVVALLQLFVLTLRLDTDDQKLRSGEITVEEIMNEADIAHTIFRAVLTFLLSLIIAGVAFIIDNTRKLSDEIDDLPE